MKAILIILFLVIPVAVIYSQSVSSTLTVRAPRGYQPGYVILADSTRIEGFIRNNIRHWSSIIILQPDGRKTTYTASQLREAVINETTHVSIEGEWYTVLESGRRLNLLQKSSAQSDGIQYNGSEPVGAVSKGSFQDYFLQHAGQRDSLLIRVSAANVDVLVRHLMAGCAMVQALIQDKKVMIKEMRELVRKYNSCEE